MKKLQLVALGLFLILGLKAQYAPAIDLFDEVGNVQFSIGSDVDGDGRTDVICGTSNRLFWLPQLDDGTFGHQNPINLTDQTYRTLTGLDIDGDGDEDLLFVSFEAGFGIHFNNGDGTYSPPTAIFNPGAVMDVYLADINGDAIVDALVGLDQGVSWLEGQGDGTFSDAQLISADHDDAFSVHAEDLDGDGDRDVIVAAHTDNRLSWHENLGGGTFADFQTINDTHLGPNAIITGDFNGDGTPEIICSNRLEVDGGAGLTRYHYLGDGDFSAPDTLLPAYGNFYAQTKDMDGDGDLDLVSCHRYGEVGWFRNDGTGFFGEDIKLQDYAAHQRFVDLPDLNGDGFPDILYGINRSNPGKEALLWLESEGDGEFAQPELLELGVYNVSIPVVADIDQDGRPDVILGSRGTDALVWVRNEGNGKYSQPNLIARRHNYDPGSIEVLDFNNDGWPDILAGSIQDDVTGPSLFSVYINNTDGTFSATPTFPTNYHIQRDLQMADMDGDGDLDMLWASPGYNSMPNGYAGWVPNNGDSWGDPVYIWEEVENVLDVHAADINGDGLNDVIVCKGDFPQIDYRINLGNAEFYDLHTISTDYARAMYAQVADINGDGLMDLIASADVTNGSGGADQISWWPGTGGGFFGAQQSIHIGGPAMEKFEIVDYDQDGVDDIITSGFQDFPMQWLKGHGDGNFEPPVAIPNSPIAVRGFQLVDMDDDGDLDMVGSAEVPPNGGTDRIVVSYNLANDVGVSGQVFFDGNANGQHDADEVLLNRFPIAVEPEALAVFSDDQGRFSVYGAEGTYNISPQLEDCWTLTTSPETYEINFSGIPVDSLEFGVSPNTNEPEASITLASAPTRCGFTVPFWLNYNNDGCWPFDGQAYLVLNELVEFVEATPAPAQVSGDTLFWDFTTLQPGESRSVALTMVIAGVEFLGTTIELPLGVVPYDVSGEALPAETFDFASVINCAYDPNDKQVYPARGQQPPFTENYTLFDEPLLYTIRFQNTGTDTAFNVVLRDQLSSHLDWETFFPGSSSHPYEATLYEDGRVEFYFRDILLPDSTTNEPRSHGFVQFEIEALPGLDEQTIIENTAGIYFDFNPPIITNTVENTMVSELPDFTPAAAFAFESSELQVVFTDVSSNDPTSWLWDLGDGNTSTAQHPEHLYATSGTYTVCLTAANDWGAHTTCEEITLISTSSIDLSFSKAIFVHPNPASEQVWIRSVSASVPQRLQLYNSTGQLIQTLTLNGKVMSVDVSGLATGRYWLRTESGEVLPLTIAR